MAESIKSRAIALYDRFTHEGMDRRDFMGEMTKLAGSVAAANALIAAIAASPAAAAIVPADDPRLITKRGPLGKEEGALKGYIAVPRAATGKKIGSVIVIHENRGLNAHIEDVARRVALAGFFAVAPDFLTPLGGTPANEDQAREMIGKLNLGVSVASAVTLSERLRRLRHSNGKVGAIGFCWGGAFVNRLATAAGDKLDAGVSFYGSAPDPSEASKVRAPLLLLLAELDQRVNATALPWAEALRKSSHSVTSIIYPGVNHAFHNDTSAERYNKEAAERAWQTTVEFFRTQLR
ncbi:dienelactone hydrolase family protein [Allosphingosinicella flava]|uniref:Dienelactone hydrolase family protein n=1 Tax=Allosphingosinicella flava TaxID=2771430 RepID=A0A7T2LN69_9SPHN|nr:dienelactone hydrolase family protein [Sphingosinicella flava]QPQ56063.1 dienelactone hydrolase family protein [Sphingosinicella flava]